MKTIFVTLKAILAIAAFETMYIVAHFNLGTREQWDDAVNNDFLSFFGIKFLGTLIIGCLFFPLSLLTNYIFRKTVSYKLKNALFESLALIILSALFVLEAFYF